MGLGTVSNIIESLTWFSHLHHGVIDVTCKGRPLQDDHLRTLRGSFKESIKFCADAVIPILVPVAYLPSESGPKVFPPLLNQLPLLSFRAAPPRDAIKPAGGNVRVMILSHNDDHDPEEASLRLPSPFHHNSTGGTLCARTLRRPVTLLKS